jgi:hypothetical protein
MRAHLVRCGAEDHVLALALDHVAADGWSLDILVRDLSTAYDAVLVGKAPELTDSPPYQDWAERQRDGVERGRVDEVADYWITRLGPDPSAFAVSLPGYRPGQELAEPACLRLDVPVGTAAALDSACRRLRVTPYCASLAALKALIAWRTGRPRVTVLTTAANRLDTDYQDTVGWFANGVFPTTEVDLSRSFGDLVGTVREHVLAATAHGDLPASYVRRRMWPSMPPGFRKDPGIYFMFNDLWGRDLQFIGTRVSPEFLEETADSPGLHLWLLREGTKITLTVLHYRSEYPDDCVREFAADFLAVIAAFADSSGKPVGAVLSSAIGARPTPGTMSES